MDETLLRLINRDWTHPALDRFMAVMSSLPFWMPALVVGVIVLAIRGGFRGRAFLVVAGLAVAVNDGGVSRGLKKWADRPRPHQALAGVRQLDLAKARPRFLALARPLRSELSDPDGEDVDGRSFPSSHTMNTTAVALVAARAWRRWGWLAFAVPGLVGWSRVYTGAHWPSDVAASWALGLAVTTAVLAAAQFAWRRFGPRWAGTWNARHPSLFGAPITDGARAFGQPATTAVLP